MEINQIESSDYLSNEKKINKKHNKFNEDIIILDKSFYNYENNNNNEDKDKNKNPIFILTIELEEGKIAKLEIFSDSNSDNLAKKFCNDNNLDETTFQYLKEKIEFLLQEFQNNKDKSIQKYINDINNNLNIDNENKEFVIEDNKSDYFNNYINDKNKSNIKENNKSSISKGFDINNITIKKNIISKHRAIIRSNTDKKLYKNIKRTPSQTSYKKNQNFEKSSNKSSSQASIITNYLLDKSKVYNNKKNEKVDIYYNNYATKSLNKIILDNNYECSKDTFKNITNRDNIKINEENSFIDNIFQDNEKERKSRRKSSYFKSYISKNESIGKNMTNFDTYSSSKINTESFITNNVSSRTILKGIKFNKENPVMLNNKKIYNYGQYLYERNKITKLEKQNEIFEIQRNEEIDEFKLCSFKPKTNIKKNSNIHSKYKDNNSQKMILNEEQYNFKPKINNNYNTDLNFEQRQKIFHNLYKKRTEELKNLFQNSKFDEKGNELFKPKIISKQYYNKDDNINIFDKNYSYYQKYNYNKMQLIKKFNKNNGVNKKICPKEKTEKILNDAYTKVFTKLFNDLDSDQDNLITSLTINTSDIPKNILKIMEPILKELREDNQTLNCEEFILVMIRLFEDTPLVDRQNLINYYRNKIKMDNHSLQRSKTPNHFELYKNDINLNNNILLNNSFKSIFLKNKNDNMGINHERKTMKEIGNIYDLNDDYNGLEKKNYSNNINIQNEINGGLTAISKYTFNNYLKQVKS